MSTTPSVAKAQAVFARMDSVGQQRMSRLHGGRRDQLEISPNLWAGVGLVRGGAGTALVGDPETVAARMREYMELGHRDLHPLRLPASRGVLPLRRAGLPAAAAQGDAPAATRKTVRNAGPFGEIIANEIAAGPAGAGGLVSAGLRARSTG